jgi:hypothetical protein
VPLLEVRAVTEREHCAAVAREIRAKIERAPGDPTYRLADRIERERAAVREEACKAVCYFCAKGCPIATTTAAGHELPYDGPWHVNDIDPMVLSLCQAKAIRALVKP